MPSTLPEPAGRLRGTERWLVPASLALAYLANDGEELLTMADSLGPTLERLPGGFPRPARLPDQAHVRVGIGVVGLVMAAAVADGWRTGGRGRLYQDAQLAWGVHGFGHVAASLVTRGYTSGVLTAPTVVVPQWLWARSRLRQAGVADRSSAAGAAAVLVASLGTAHALGFLASAAARR